MLPRQQKRTESLASLTPGIAVLSEAGMVAVLAVAMLDGWRCAGLPAISLSPKNITGQSCLSSSPTLICRHSKRVSLVHLKRAD